MAIKRELSRPERVPAEGRRRRDNVVIVPALRSPLQGPQDILDLQRAAGNRAVTELLSRGDDKGKPIQRFKLNPVNWNSKHKEEHQDQVKASPVAPGYEQALAAAVLLDHDAAVRNLLIDPANASSVAKLDPPALHLAALTNLNEADLRKIIVMYATQGGSSSGAMTHSIVEWGPRTAFGSGSSVAATLIPDGHAPGSDAGGWPDWAIALAHRADHTKSLFVRGHLLNRHLGGPGLDYNMVPITGRKSWHGANHANDATLILRRSRSRRGTRRWEQRVPIGSRASTIRSLRTSHALRVPSGHSSRS